MKGPSRLSADDDRRCVVAAEGLHEVALGSRVGLDLLVTVDDELLVFLSVDGEILVELVTLGSA